MDVTEKEHEVEMKAIEAEHTRLRWKQRRQTQR